MEQVKHQRNKPKQAPYACIRCGYNTPDKSKMKTHLFVNKKMCPTILNNIELTDAIKHHIIDFRIYHLPKHISPQTINYNQNIIYGLDTLDKLNAILCHQKQALLSFQNQVGLKFSSNVQALESGEKHELKTHDLYEIVDQVSGMCKDNVEEFNMFYDEKVNKLALYDSGTWQKLLYIAGIVKLITTIQNVYLNAYEKYLIQKTEDTHSSYQARAKFEELIVEYYRFLVAFGVKPMSQTCLNDSELVPCMSRNNYDVKDRFSVKYIKVVDNMKQSEITKIGKEILDILKRNSKRNLEDLNRKMMSLFNMDDEFKTSILKMV
jgi:hypothetical protein